jgi:alkanesulfonate monooxygenase SsuD/methylene tetrahydromethanopterin reductase-like flavin-dependent oxidoreductase (luciferase family)
VVGLGLGWNADEHAAAGIVFPNAEERSRRLAAAAERIRCEVQVPLLIGGSGARGTLPLAARFANEWNMTTASVADFSRVSNQLDTLCAQVGRAPREITRSVACGILLGDDIDDLRARAERMRSCVAPLAGATDVLQAAREMGWLVGTTDEIRSRLAEFAAAGAGRIILGHYNLGDLSTLELVASLT